MTAKRPPASGFVYCRHCQTVSIYQEDDLFADELFCPACAARTLAEDRRSTKRQALSLNPEAELYHLDSRAA